MVVRQGVASGRSIRDAVDTLSGSTQILGCILNDVRKVGFLSGLLSGGYGGRGSSENNGGGKRQ